MCAYDFAVLDLLPHPVWRSGVDCQGAGFNRSWLEFTGRKLEQELGSGWLEGMHPDDREAWIKAYRLACDAQGPFTTEYRLRHHSGQYRWVKSFGQPFKDQEGRVDGYIGSCFDITATRETEAALQANDEYLRSALNRVPFVLFYLDARGTITLLEGQGVSAFLKRKPDDGEVIGHSVEEFLERWPRGEEYLQRALAGEEFYATLESREQIFEVHYLPQFDENNAVSGVLGILSNITDRRRTEETLKRRSAQFQLLRDITSAANRATSVEEAFQFAIDQMCAYTGWAIGHAYILASASPLEVFPSHLWYLSDPERFDGFRRVTQELPHLSACSFMDQVYRSGRSLWVENVQECPGFGRKEIAIQEGIRQAFAVPVLAGEESVAVIEFFGTTTEKPGETTLAMIEDMGVQVGRVIERQRAAAALQASKRLFEGIFESAPDAIILVNLSGQIERANQQTVGLFGYGPAELIGKPIEMLVPESLRQQHVEHRLQYQAEPARRSMGVGLDLYGLRRDGQQFPIDVTLSPLYLGKMTQIICIIRDLSRRKEIERELREKNKLIENAVTGAPLGLFLVDPHGIIKVSLGRSAAILRDTFGTPLGHSIFDLYQDVPQMVENFQCALQGESVGAIVEFPQGVIYFTRYTPVRDDRDEIVGVAGVALEITDLHRLEDALRASEARFRTIFEDAALGIKLIDLEGRILVVNPALEEMLGYSANELYMRHYADIMLPPDVEKRQEVMQEMLDGKSHRCRVEIRYIHKSGAIIWARVTMTLFRNDQGHPQYIIGMVENITSQRQNEAELAEVERRLIDRMEAERLHLAQELHDGPMQELYGVFYEMKALWQSASEQFNSAQVRDIPTTLQHIIQELRVISGELRPPTLAPFGLERAILSHAERMQQMYPDISIKLNLMKDELELPEHVRLALFRIYQHSLMNALRHANARSVEVRFALDAQQITLVIRDDGQGFDVPRRWVELVRQGHYGLVGAAERAQSIGGSLRIKSSRGVGTIIRVIVPRETEYRPDVINRLIEILKDE